LQGLAGPALLAAAATGQAGSPPAFLGSPAVGPAHAAAPEILSVAPASGPAAAEPLPAPSQPAVALDLPGLCRLALEKQPALAAYRASLAAAHAKSDALERLCVPTILRRDLPVRREQAHHGIRAAEAQLCQAEQDTLYAVTRTYYSVLYARRQQTIARDILDPENPNGIANLRKLTEAILKERTARLDVRDHHLAHIDALIQTVKARSQDAIQGEQRALAALREAIGLGPGESLTVASGAQLPQQLPPVPDQAQVIALALHHRGEVTQAEVGAAVTGLEVTAQDKSHRATFSTFAAGSDLHATPVPQGEADGEYRPWAVGLEMPTMLVGSRSARVEQAQALEARAAAVVQKTRNLVALQAEEAYHRWREASGRYDAYKKGADDAEKAAAKLRDPDPDKGGFDPGKAGARIVARPNLDDVIEARTRATQLRVLANQAQFEMLIALANLQRVTAGGYCPGILPVP
jgi:outer membrane protein TolC